MSPRHYRTVPGYVVLTLLMFATMPALGASLQLASDKQTQYAIVRADRDIPSEREATRELQSHLRQITAADFKIVPEAQHNAATPGIYVGWTNYATGRGIPLEELKDDEWLIVTAGRDLILTGGRPRGVLHAVYGFLERELGCRWYDRDLSLIPQKTELAISGLNRRVKPVFKGRHMGYARRRDRDLTLRARNKDTRATLPAKYGFGYSVSGHSFYHYMRRFPEPHPEYRALDKAGKRPRATSGSGPGQICLTNPDARNFILSALLENLTTATEQNRRKGEGKTIRFAVMSPNDSHWACQCPDCREIATREGGDSGPLLDMVNFFAESIQQDFPGMLVETMAYSNTLERPKGLRPHPNVRIRMAQLNGDFASDARRRGTSEGEYPDFFRPMSAPVNAEARQSLIEWSRLAKQMAYWDYWMIFGEPFPTPTTNLHCIQSDIKLLRDCGVEDVYAEFHNHTGTVLAMQRWVGWKLLEDPDQDLHALVAEYTKAAYGPAAKKMQAYLRHLTDAIERVPDSVANMTDMEPWERPYLTLAFYTKAQQLLDEAEALCTPGSKVRLRVEQEREPLDLGLYCMWFLLERELPPGKTMPWKREDVLNRYRQRALAKLEFLPSVRRKQSRERLEQRLRRYRGISDGFRNRPSSRLLFVPRLDTETHSLAAVDWSKAAQITSWTTFFGGTDPDRHISGAMAHGGKNLYLKLAESGMRPIQDVNRWRSRNQWEIFFVPDKRERLYKQLGFDADGVCYSYVYDDGQLPWANGAVFKNSFTRDEWLLLLAIPLKEVMPQTQRSDRRFYCNILRLMPGAANKMSLSPPFDNDHHSLSNLAEVRLGGVNLLVNPDFSQALTGWRTRAKAVLDRHASPKTDGVSVRIDCKDGYGILLSQGFKATAPAYGVSGWVKTEGFANRWQARIELVAGFRDEEGKAQAKLYTIGATPQHKADSPWTKFERIIEIPAESYSVNCWLSTRHPRNQNEQPNPGTVWFSDLTMVPIGGAQAE